MSSALIAAVWLMLRELGDGRKRSLEACPRAVVVTHAID